MNASDSEPTLSKFSPPGFIAWLSLFLLSFALGGMVNEEMHHVSLKLGAFGLVAAVGLGSIEKARRLRAKFLRDRALRERLDRQIGVDEWDAANGAQLPLKV
jgi:hypothetical protein